LEELDFVFRGVVEEWIIDIVPMIRWGEEVEVSSSHSTVRKQSQSRIPGNSST